MSNSREKEYPPKNFLDLVGAVRAIRILRENETDFSKLAPEGDPDDHYVDGSDLLTDDVAWALDEFTRLLREADTNIFLKAFSSIPSLVAKADLIWMVRLWEALNAQKLDIGKKELWLWFAEKHPEHAHLIPKQGSGKTKWLNELGLGHLPTTRAKTW